MHQQDNQTKRRNTKGLPSFCCCAGNEIKRVCVCACVPRCGRPRLVTVRWCTEDAFYALFPHLFATVLCHHRDSHNTHTHTHAHTHTPQVLQALAVVGGQEVKQRRVDVCAGMHTHKHAHTHTYTNDAPQVLQAFAVIGGQEVKQRGGDVRAVGQGKGV